MLGHVGDKVMNVVRALPPADGQTIAEIAHKGANDGVDYEITCDTTVACIVSDEHDLLLYGGGSASCLKMHVVRGEYS